MMGYAGENQVDITNFDLPLVDKNNLKAVGIATEDVEKYQDEKAKAED